MGYQAAQGIRSKALKVQINGEQHELPEGVTVEGLLERLSMKPDRVAVELNLSILPRANWPGALLREGDRLEIVHFVGGGST